MSPTAAHHVKAYYAGLLAYALIVDKPNNTCIILIFLKTGSFATRGLGFYSLLRKINKTCPI